MPVAKRWFLLLAALTLVLLPSLAQAYKYYYLTKNRAIIRWDGNYIDLYINQDGMPAGAFQAIQDSFNTWSNAGSPLVMVNKGLTDSHAYGELDYTNIIDMGELDSASTLAETTWWYSTSTGAVRDTDIRLNKSLAWDASGSSEAYDVQNLVTHELGHTLVLGDLYGSGDREKTMYGYGEKGETKKRTLETDDINGINFLY